MTRSRWSGVAVGAALLAVAALITWAPRLLLAVDLGGRSLTGVQWAEAVSRVRQSVLAAVGGLAVLLGAYVGWRRLRLNEQELQTARDGQVTERFTRAIDQLGSENTDVRIGGLFALERIARNSPVDRDAVIETIGAFVRRHSLWPPGPGQPAADAPMADVATLATRAGDVQAAVTVLVGTDHRSARRDPAGRARRLCGEDLTCRW